MTVDQGIGPPDRSAELPAGVRHRTSIGEIARLFLKLGVIGFGGPAAHIALMEDEVVRRRGWLTRESFLDYVGATNLIPGPNSTELAIEIGRDRGGPAGLVVAGAAFIVPATVIVAAIAWAYVRFGQLPAAVALLAGVKPVVIAIVAQALWRLARTAVKNAWLAAVAVGSIAAVALGVHELVVLASAALLAVAMVAARARSSVVAPWFAFHARSTQSSAGMDGALGVAVVNTGPGVT